MGKAKEPTFVGRLKACIAVARASSGVSVTTASKLDQIAEELLAAPMAVAAVRKHSLALVEEANRKDDVPPVQSQL